MEIIERQDHQKWSLTRHPIYISFVFIGTKTYNLLRLKNKRTCPLSEDMNNNKKCLYFQQVVTRFSSHFRKSSLFPVFHLNRILKVFDRMGFSSLHLCSEKEGFPLGYFPKYFVLVWEHRSWILIFLFQNLVRFYCLLKYPVLSEYLSFRLHG